MRSLGNIEQPKWVFVVRESYLKSGGNRTQTQQVDLLGTTHTQKNK